MQSNFVDRKIVLLAQSRPTSEGLGYMAEKYKDNGADDRKVIDNVHFGTYSQVAPVFAGRVCYMSFDLKNEDTSSPEDYLKNILNQKHGSVLEHSSFTFMLENISRAATHEIVRHRHFSFSQESQRFVIEKRGWDVVQPPIMRGDRVASGALLNAADEAFITRDYILRSLKDSNHYAKRKQVAEAARSVIPNAAATNIVVTGNARSWMEFIDKRAHPAADAELREIAWEIHDKLAEVMPAIFGEEPSKLWQGISNQEGVKNDGK